MRKYDLFGNKNKRSQPLYILVIVFVLLVASYTAILIIYNTRISNMQTENSLIQQNINSLLLNEESRAYAEVDELLPYLPESFEQATVYNELILARDLSGLQSASNFNLSFTDDSDSPFQENINGDLNYVKIIISFTTNNTSLPLDLLNQLISFDRVYYIQSIALDILSTETTQVSIVAYTFYID